MKCKIGLIGLGVMGENLIINMANSKINCAVYNRSTEKLHKFISTRGNRPEIVGADTLEKFVQTLELPRKILLMVKSGEAVDDMIDQLLPLLTPGDIIIDGGNSYFKDTIRRDIFCRNHDIDFVGMGVSGGEYGALHGPALMIGSSQEAWNAIKKICQTICAKPVDPLTGETIICAQHLGPDGAGHYVKMVHNGIEYSDMQLISEAYDFLQRVLGLKAPELGEIFEKWNNSFLESYLVEITAKVLKKVDPQTQRPLVEVILDAAGQKGTGKWTSESALDLSVPVPGITEAVFARFLSALKDQRVEGAAIFGAKDSVLLPENEYDNIIKAVEHALYASKICAYAQGLQLLQKASEEYKWNLDMNKVVSCWRGGCIIRAAFLQNVQNAYIKNPKLANLLFDEFFTAAIKTAEQSWRQVASLAALHAVPMPGFFSALSYFDSITSKRLPANLIQGQRDFFGAHTYERIDRPRGEFFHTEWED